MERAEVDLPFLKKQSCSVPLVMRWPEGISNGGGKKQASTFQGIKY